MNDTPHQYLDAAISAASRLVLYGGLERPAMDAACDAYLALHRVRDALAGACPTDPTNRDGGASDRREGAL